MVEIINSISRIMLMPAIIMFLLGTGIYFFVKDKIYRYPAQGWLSIKEHPIPEDIKDFIATDGKTVKTLYGPTWGPHGKVIFGSIYDSKDRIITHWQPLPEAPKEEFFKLKKGE